MKGYGLHQDWIAWDGFPRSFLTVLVPFDPADRDNGCTVVYPGYHHAGPLTPQDGQYHELPADTVDEATGGAAACWSRATWRCSAASPRTAPTRTCPPAGGGSCTSATTGRPTAATSATRTTASSTLAAHEVRRVRQDRHYFE